MNNLEKIKHKIISGDQITSLLKALRDEERRIVFTNGCFDVIHQGHINYLSQAADLGTFFIVGLNTDDSVKRLKGEGRPVQDETARAIIMAALEMVDAVILFDEDTPFELINLVKPDVLVKGGDYKAEEIVGYDIVSSYGGRVVTLGFLEGHSSSSIIEKLS